MNYDDDHLGVNNFMHPANEIEVEVEQATIDQWYLDELKQESKTLKLLKEKLKRLIHLDEINEGHDEVNELQNEIKKLIK